MRKDSHFEDGISTTVLLFGILSESGPAGVALLHHPPRGAAGRAAASLGHPGGLSLPHAVGRVRQGLAAPQQLHGLRPQGWLPPVARQSR